MAFAQQSPEWLRKTDDETLVRIKGFVVDPNGDAIDDFSIKVAIDDDTLETKIDENRFEVWVPTSKMRLTNLKFFVSSTNGNSVGYKQLRRRDLRQAAIDGIEITSLPFDHSVDVTVKCDEQPVGRANVIARTSTGRVTEPVLTNKNGSAVIGLFENEKLGSITAWTDDHKIGGFSFHRAPDRKQDADHQTLELWNCRSVNFVALNDETDQPVANLKCSIYINHGPPDYDGLFEFPHRTIVTDTNGKYTYQWLPEWDTHNVYVDCKDQRWIKALTRH